MSAKAVQTMKIKALFITLAAFLAILFSVPTPAGADMVDEIIYYTNKERVSRNLRPLKVDRRLSQAAQRRAKELASNFSHTRPNGRDWFTVCKEFRVSFSEALENIAFNNHDRKVAARVFMSNWMKSPGHRDNILQSNMTRIGVGVYKQGKDNYAVQLFMVE
ncbi:MAG: CAP domain-containing protein [Deltaproteobacteria bacterium]|nr:CAP domain-containing protein [Deltaproteobacteria bacterium]